MLSGRWALLSPGHLVEDGQHGPAIQGRCFSFPTWQHVEVRLFSISGLPFSCPLLLQSCSNLGLQSLLVPKLAKLDDGWPESEKGDVTATLNMMITR